MCTRDAVDVDSVGIRGVEEEGEGGEGSGYLWIQRMIMNGCGLGLVLGVGELGEWVGLTFDRRGRGVCYWLGQ